MAAGSDERKQCQHLEDAHWAYCLMKTCLTCGHCYEDTDTACTRDGHGLLMPSRPGSRVIDGKYRLEKLLGRGGMGAVYAGVHVELERPTAIKLLLPNLVSDPQALERFKREARAAARLNHPNVAGTYDFGTIPGGESYIVMELLEGETLRDHIGASGPLPFGEAVLIARQVADGIESAHRGGIIHRDLKPSNIVVSRDHHGSPFVKVLDFGVAKLKEHSTTGGLDITRAGALVGTPRYMSPEQCADQKVDARSDVYSLGVMLYEMLTGRAPFDATSAMALALKHIKESPPPLEELRPDVPAALSRLVTWALAKDPAERPQTAAEFSRALHAAGEQMGLSSPVVSAATAAPPEVEQRPEVERRPEVGQSGDREAPATSAESDDRPSTPVKVARTPDPLPESVEDLPDRAPGAGWRKRLPLVLAMAVLFVVSAVGAALFLKWRNQSPTVSADANTHSADAPSPAPSQEAPVGGGAPSPEVEVTPTPAATLEKKEPARSPETDRRALQSALTAWVAATNSRDVKSQLNHYATRLDVFYLSRNVSREAVLREKRNTFGRASRVSITVADPSIEVGRDGLTAVMKFRKRYVIESGGKRQSGEVLQELQWSRARSDKSEWKITGERDLQVIR
jgi:serine/threonine protein kinase